MLFKTRGIVFRFTKFGETSIVVNIFTERFGLQGYMVNGVRSKSAKNKIALYQPLTLVEMVVYHRGNANLERIKEIKCIHPFHSLTIDVRKSTIAMFMIELMNKTIREESHSGDIFNFLFDSVIELDSMTEGFENFHLVFMLGLSRYLGFGVHNVNEVMGGRMTEAATEEKIAALIASRQSPVALTHGQRREILDLLLQFYAEHIESLGEMRSVPVLREILG